MTFIFTTVIKRLNTHISFGEEGTQPLLRTLTIKSWGFPTMLMLLRCGQSVSSGGQYSSLFCLYLCINIFSLPVLLLPPVEMSSKVIKGSLLSFWGFYKDKRHWDRVGWLL